MEANVLTTKWLNIILGSLLLAIFGVACTSVISRTVSNDGVFGLGTEQSPHVGHFLKLLDPDEGVLQAYASDATGQDIINKSFGRLEDHERLQDVHLQAAQLNLLLVNQLEVKLEDPTGVFPDSFVITHIDAEIEISDETHRLSFQSGLASDYRFVNTDESCGDENGIEECRLYRHQHDSSTNSPLLIARFTFEKENLMALRTMLISGSGSNHIAGTLTFYGDDTSDGTPANSIIVQPAYFDRSVLTFSL